MDSETMKLASELTDKITTIGVLLVWVSWLIRENSLLKQMLFGDWKEQSKEEREALKSVRQKANGNGTGL